MSDRPIGLGKVAENGTLNENGAFYSVQDINVLLENGGGSSGGGDLPTPTVADAGSVVVVNEEGKYALGEAGGGDNLFIVTISSGDDLALTADKTFAEILSALESGKIIIYSFYGAKSIANNIFGGGDSIQSIGCVFVSVDDTDSDNLVLQVNQITIKSDNTIVDATYTAEQNNGGGLI